MTLPEEDSHESSLGCSDGVISVIQSIMLYDNSLGVSCASSQSPSLPLGVDSTMENDLRVNTCTPTSNHEQGLQIANNRGLRSADPNNHPTPDISAVTTEMAGISDFRGDYLFWNQSSPTPNNLPTPDMSAFSTKSSSSEGLSSDKGDDRPDYSNSSTSERDGTSFSSLLSRTILTMIPCDTPCISDLITNNPLLSRDDLGGLGEAVLDVTPCIMRKTVDPVDLDNSDALLEISAISLLSPNTVISEGTCNESGSELDPLAPLFVPALVADFVASPFEFQLNLNGSLLSIDDPGGPVSVLDVTPCAIGIVNKNSSAIDSMDSILSCDSNTCFLESEVSDNVLPKQRPYRF